MASTHKKVVVHRFEREAITGYVNPSTYVKEGGLELLSLDGNFSLLPWTEVKAVCFVRDLNEPGIPRGEKTFLNRPKSEGLWVRMTLKDGEVMDGIMANDLLQLQEIGYAVVPPNSFSNTQRMFVPRVALEQICVVGVVGSPLARKGRKGAKAAQQIELFE